MENITFICRFCSSVRKNGNSLRNHERLCRKNPNKQQSALMKYNESPHKGSNQYTKAKALGLPKPEMTEEQRKAISERMKTNNPSKRPEVRLLRKEAAKRNNLGGWHTSRSFDHNGIRLDSSYELKFAEDLDKNKIKWSRPKPLLYRLNDEEHRYYPDFYLDDYDVYVDTKNDYLINHANPKYGITDVEKISLVSQQNNVKIYILDKNNLLWSSSNLLL